jgi:prolyl-tRNA editing enzyme YbaK/EbsC (Cys-tRNA(Pro) deacylase)
LIKAVHQAGKKFGICGQAPSDYPDFAAKILTENEEIAFNAGSQSQLINMAYQDFERLVEPRTAVFLEKLGF